MSSSANNAQWCSFTKEELTRNCTPEEIKEETKLRRETCAFLQDAGMQLRLPQLTIATAIVFFHRFYAYHKFQEYDRYIVATTCLFLAGKVEETPKKLKDVIIISHKTRSTETIQPESTRFAELREKILTHELVVLQTLAFNLTIEHPYKYLLTYVKLIQGNRHLAQAAWNLVNDSLRTTLCLQFEPRLIASAAIYLASKFLKIKLPEGKGSVPWWEIFKARVEQLDEISNQILDLYDNSPNVDAIKNLSGNSADSNTSPSQVEGSSATNAPATPNNNNNNDPATTTTSTTNPNNTSTTTTATATTTATTTTTVNSSSNASSSSHPPPPPPHSPPSAGADGAHPPPPPPKASPLPPSSSSSSNPSSSSSSSSSSHSSSHHSHRDHNNNRSSSDRGRHDYDREHRDDRDGHRDHRDHRDRDNRDYRDNRDNRDNRDYRGSRGSHPNNNHRSSNNSSENRRYHPYDH